MALSLFDRLHDIHCCPDRNTPASIEEFLEFGLQPEDYVNYVAMQYSLQGELMLFGHPKSESYTSKDYKSVTHYPTLERLITFCKEKNLIQAESIGSTIYDYLAKVDRSDAEYYYGWLRYPREPSEFRLCIERKLSWWWDAEEAILDELFDGISFTYDDYTELADGGRVVAFDSPVRIRKYDPAMKSSRILNNGEVRKIYLAAKQEKEKIEARVADHLKDMPDTQDSAALVAGLPWIKKIYDLLDRQELIDGIFEMVCDAVNTPDVIKFKESDVLFVYCGDDYCRQASHLVSSTRVEFCFYGKPDKQYTIDRCSHCLQYRISLSDLIKMFDDYGVPRCNIVYDSCSGGDFSDFSETSVFYEMGYTVSQSVGLSAVRRQAILKHAIDTGKASKEEVLRYLRQRMNINGNKVGNEIAYRKWKEDFDYITKL